MDCAENEFVALTVYYWNWTIFAHTCKVEFWTKHVRMARSCLVTKKIVGTTNKAALEVCYWLLYTVLGDGIVCILSLNHNIHGGKWCLSAMHKMSFEVKKWVRNAFFSRDLETQMLKFPLSLPIKVVPQEILT